jgi:hypothetical protein
MIDKEQKDIVPGIDVFNSHKIINHVDNDVEVEITTFAHLTPLDWGKLVKVGWVQRAPNVAAYIKIRYSEDYNTNAKNRIRGLRSNDIIVDEGWDESVDSPVFEEIIREEERENDREE